MRIYTVWHTRDTRLKGKALVLKGLKFLWNRQTSSQIIPTLFSKCYDMVMHNNQKGKLNMCQERIA